MPSILLAALLALPGVDAQVSLLEGAPVAGPLAQLSAEKVVVGSAAGPVEIAASKILQVELVGQSVAPAPAGAQLVELIDGTSLVASSYAVAEGLAAIETVAGLKVEARTRAIRSVRLKEPNPLHDKSWEELLAKKTEEDLLVVRTKSSTGEALDFLEGIIYDITATQVAFKFAGDPDTTMVSRARVEGVIYVHPENREFPPPAAELYDVGGSKWNAKTLELADDQVAVTTLVGVKATIPLVKLARLDYSSGKLVRLADLPHELQRWSLPPDAGILRTLPSAQALFGPRRDRWVQGEEGLNLVYHKNEQEEVRTLPDGLALRADTTLLYRLPNGSRRFTAIVGVDGRPEPSGEVKLIVLGDANTLYEGVLSRDRDPVSLDLDLTGVRRLTIKVERAPPLDVSHRLNLCTPRIWK